MRILLLALLSLAGCGGVDPDSANRTASAAADLGDGRIDCRIGNAAQFERSCTLERGKGESGATLILRKPDGGFRRLLVTSDGRGVVAADGAEPAQVTVIGDDRIEVAIGGDAFRLPATVQNR